MEHEFYDDGSHLFGEFFGKHLSTSEADLLAIRFLNPKVIEKEQQLMRVKWFDYRFMHPTKATYLYIHYYTRLYREMYAMRVDKNEAQHKRGIRFTDLAKMPKAQATAFWKGRQTADTYGTPYDYYLRAVMTETHDRLWTEIPRPAQLYSKAFADHAANDWLDTLDARIIAPEHRFLRGLGLESLSEECRATVATTRLACEKYLLGLIVKRSIPSLSLGHFLFDDPILQPATVIETLGLDVYEQVRRLHRPLLMN